MTTVLLDIDGVLTVSWQALPDAPEVINWLTTHDITFRLVTNTSSKVRSEIAEALADAGMPVRADHILTAVTAAGEYLRSHHRQVPVLVVNEGDLSGELVGIDCVGIREADRAGAVLLGGAGPSTGWREFNAAFRLISNGAPLIALHRNARFQTADGPALDMGAFLVGLEGAADVHAVVTGKPAAEFFRAALSDLDAAPAAAVMVGDDIGSDVRGAQAVGITGVLVRTGKFRESDLTDDGADPDHGLAGIGELPELLERL